MPQSVTIGLEELEETNQTVNSESISDKDVNAANNNKPRKSGMNNTSIKKSLVLKIQSKLPPLPLIRTVIKASIASLVASIFVFDSNCRKAFGTTAVLVPLATTLYFPVKPIGAQIEATIVGAVGVSLTSAWTALAMYLANLARDMTNPSPVQPNSSAVLIMFMLVGVFSATYLRVKVAQVMHGTVFACIIIAFSLTQASVTPGFDSTIVFTYLKPHLTAAAATLMVNLLVWPEDVVTKYLDTLQKSLNGYNDFFKTHADTFVSTELTPAPLSLPSLHASLQGSILKVIDGKREVQREILYNRLSHSDIQDLTRLVKSFSVPLHGVGLSVITKIERLNELHSENFYKMADEYEVSQHKQEFLQGLREMRSVTQELTFTCTSVLTECTQRLMAFSGRPRSWRSTFLWPFPRLFRLFLQQTSPQKSESMLERLDQMIAKHEQESRKSSHIFIEPEPSQFEDQFNSLLQIIYLFRFNARDYAHRLRDFVAYVEQLEEMRIKRRVSFPRLPVRKWFRSLRIDTSNTMHTTESTTLQNPGDLDLTLIHTTTRQDLIESQEVAQLVNCKDAQGRLYTRDPDVDPPESAFERLFFHIYRVLQWSTSVDTAFAFKTASGFVLLSLPAFLPQSAEWFIAWKGPWATFTMVLWMFPTAGMFFFTVTLRLLGTIFGGVLGIIIWEIVRGNPFGLAILNFLVMIPLFYLFFTRPTIAMFILMMQITNVLVIGYAYEYKMSGQPVYDSVEVIAGKRMLLVCIGVGASSLLSLFPKPVTGRVELRKRISKTLRNLSELYGILAMDILTHFDESKEPTDGQQKAFRKLGLNIRRQISDARMYLRMSKMEPPLRGKFPVEVYARLIEKLDNMADLVQLMAHASRSAEKSWKKNLVMVIKEERMEFLASILSIMKILSSTLASKMALPPFMLSPQDLRIRLSEKLRYAIRKNPEQLDNDSFPSYCCYVVSSHQFAIELEQVVECVERLVGVEDPEHWLSLNA